MAINGVNPGEVRNALSKVGTAYSNLMTETTTKMQDYFTGMATRWYSPNAKKCFTQLASDMNGINDSVNQTIKSVYASMNSAAKRVVQRQGGEYTDAKFTQNNKKLKSEVKENAGGKIGSSTDVEEYTKGKLNSIKNNASQALVDLLNAVEKSGFYDDSDKQQTALTGALRKIKTKLEETIDNVYAYITKTAKTERAETTKDINANTTAFNGGK